MFASIGHALSLVGLAFAAGGMLLAPFAAWTPTPRRMAALRVAIYGFAIAMLSCNVAMMVALVRHDFSVSYVAQVGSRAAPLWVTVVSLWSSLEGSILFWGAVLGLYLLAFVWTTHHHLAGLVAWAQGTSLMVATFFALLICGPANPFRLVSPVPADGPGANPLLQNHILMAIHPPLLYLGYVGMTLPFAVATAALITGKLPPAWLRLLRSTMLVPWAFLSIGIVLGSWWAYEVLGWGGFWAWDPVENASFLPWLAATGYLHATVALERRKVFRAWTLTLVQSAFLLTILGTFMTRSGVFNSVHSFTQSSIGPLFLLFLAMLLLISLGLLGGRAHLLEDEGTLGGPIAKETAFLLNNVVLVALTFTVLLGTTFPLVAEALFDTKLSVGEPYYDRMAAPLGMALVFLMGVGPVLPWGQVRPRQVWRALLVPIVLGMATVVAMSAYSLGPWLTRITFGLVAFAGWVTLRELVQPAWQLARRNREPLVVAVFHTVQRQPRRMGGAVIHLAILIIAAGLCGAQTFRDSREAQLSRGEALHLGRYELTYVGAQGVEEGHRFSAVAHLRLSRDNKVLGGMSPSLNFYPNQKEPIGTPHVVTLGRDDVYVSLLSLAPNGEHVVVKLFVIPLVSWLWRSLPLLVIGSLISLWPRRRPKWHADGVPLAARHDAKEKA